MPNIDLSRVKKEHLALICIVLVVVIAFSAYKGVFNPLLGRIKKASEEIEKRKKDIQKAKISPQASEDLEHEVNELRAQIDYYKQGLRTQADVPQILKELNQIAERLKIKFISVNPLKREKTVLPKSKDYLLQIPIRIKLRCGYHQLGVFINQIENSTRLMKLTKFKINADSKDVWAHQVELVVTSFSLVSK